MSQELTPLPVSAALKPPAYAAAGHLMPVLAPRGCGCSGRHRTQMYSFFNGTNVPLFCRRPARLSRHGPSWRQMRLAGTPSSRLLRVKAGLQLSARSASYQPKVVVQGIAWLLHQRAANSPTSRLASLSEDDRCYGHCCTDALANQGPPLERCSCLWAKW